MKKHWIPAFHFPTTTLIVDDSREFLARFSRGLDNNLAYSLYASPRDALRAIQTTPNSDYLVERCFSEYVDTAGYPLTHHTVTVDVSEIAQGIYNPQRFSEVSVVIVDSTMPGMNGFEFCECINNRDIKKILLAEGYQERLAINAFNAGTIDFYANKNEPGLIRQINQYIKSLQNNYFQVKSEPLNNMLAYSSAQCLADEKFADFFHTLCAREQIAEYYLIENTGSFLLADAKGDLSCLIVKSRQDLYLHYELAVDSMAPKPVLEQLQSGQSVPLCWPNNEFCHTDDDTWSAKLYPAEKLQSKELYYYAFIKEPFTESELEKTLPFAGYLKKLSKQPEASSQTQRIVELS